MIAFIGALISLTGSLFLLLGAFGILRMPDVYNRMQAGTKATSIGSMMTILGIGLLVPGWLPKLAVLILFVLCTNPVSTNVLARAAHCSGIKLTHRTVRDNLAEDRPEGGCSDQ